MFLWRNKKKIYLDTLLYRAIQAVSFLPYNVENEQKFGY